MINPQETFQKLIDLLDDNHVVYKLYSHKKALTWEDLKKAQEETGFWGTETKCLVLKVDNKLIVYVTKQGNQTNFKAIKKKLKVSKVRLASEEELKKYFGAEPGCAYPFGFDDKYDIFVDPSIYDEDWMLFSPVLSNKTIQAKGSDLKIVFDSLLNKVKEITTFNQ